LPRQNFATMGAFSRPIPLIAGLHSPLCILHFRGTSAPPANFSSSISIFTPATLLAPVGQMLSNPNYFNNKWKAKCRRGRRRWFAQSQNLSVTASSEPGYTVTSRNAITPY
jgi:hypothetical protein